MTAEIGGLLDEVVARLGIIHQRLDWLDRRLERFDIRMVSLQERLHQIETGQQRILHRFEGVETDLGRLHAAAAGLNDGHEWILRRLMDIEHQEEPAEKTETSREEARSVGSES